MNQRIIRNLGERFLLDLESTFKDILPYTLRWGSYWRFLRKVDGKIHQREVKGLVLGSESSLRQIEV